jgi:hypothetical protein
VRRKRDTERTDWLFWIFAGLVVLAVGYGVYLRLLTPEREGTTIPITPKPGTLSPEEEEKRALPPSPADSILPQQPDQTATSQPPVVPGQPALPESDAFAREKLARLSAHPAWQAWLAQDQLIRRIAALIDGLSKGEIVRRDVAFLAPKGSFKAIERDLDRYVIDPSSYRRYNSIADAIASMDASAAGSAYAELKPLLLQAYAELGYSGQNADEKLLKALDHLLATPAINGEIELIRPSVMYKFKDPELERLSPAQKQLLRMGPRNLQKIRAKLQALKTALASPSG